MPTRRPDDKTLNIFANGDYMHLRHQAFGMVAGYITATEVPVELGKYNLRGTMDGMLATGEGLELKSINSHGFSSVVTYGARNDHVRQMHAYMLAAGLEAFRIVYENKETQQLKEIFVPRDEKLIKSVILELEELNDMTEATTLLPMLQECRNGEGRFRTCEFRKICEEATWPSESRRLILVTSSSDDG